MQDDNSKILSLLSSQPELALKLLYDKYYSYICSVIYKMIGDSGTTEDIAQEVFIEVWKRKETLSIDSSLRGYLRRTAVNKTLNVIRAKRMKFEQEDTILHLSSPEPASQLTMEAEEMRLVINRSIEALPDRCRLVFGLSRFEELSYKEIASKLEISVKTVENQISKALKLLRLAVKTREEINI
ncbi:MAG: RNA polymerase sigma-70 factor [Saprospiraceae bacterium]